MINALLKATNLAVSYSKHVPVFQDLNFSLSAGEHLGLSGPSGSGKTSLLRLCAGLYGLDHNPAVTGTLAYEKALELVTSKPKDREAFRRDVVSMITENPRAGLHPQRRIGRSWQHYRMSFKLEQGLSQLGFSDPQRIANAYPHELSGGEAQRVRLAFALSKNPKLLLLESPTAALDTENAKLVWEQVRLAKARGAAILHVDHNLRLLDKLVDHRIRLGAELPPVDDVKDEEIRLGEVVLAAADVNVTYRDFAAVSNMDIQLRAGEFVALLGPSGSGKSSFGKALAGIQPATGILEIEDGQSATRRAGVSTLQNGGAFAKTTYGDVDTRVQYIWQEPRLSMNPRFTVLKTLQEAINGRSVSPEYLLSLVDLGAEKLEQNTLSLSTGEQQRLAIARALAVNPTVLVCDEITSGLDTQRSHHVLSTLHQLRKDLGIAVLFITHDELLAERHANRRVVMGEGSNS